MRSLASLKKNSTSNSTVETDYSNNENTILISAGNDHNIIIWNWRTGEFLKTVKEAHAHKISTLGFISENRLMSSGEDNLLKFWNIGYSGNIVTIEY